MQSLARNKQKFYYAQYTGKVEGVDGEGNFTGEYTETYTKPTAYMANISPASGNAQDEPYGIVTPYTHTIVTSDVNCPISETSVIWYGIVPDEQGESGTVKHNFDVVRVAKSLNSVAINIKEVEVR